RARAVELKAKRDKLARHLSRVASPEENMDEQSNGRNHDGEDEGGDNPQGHRGADQMGTHGGPAQGQPAGGSAAEPGGEEEEKHDTSGHPGYSSEAEAQKQEGEGAAEASAEDEEEGIAAQAISRVKSIARGLMTKKDEGDDDDNPQTET